MCYEAEVSKKLVSSEYTSGKKMKEFGRGINLKFASFTVFALFLVILFVPGNPMPQHVTYAHSMRLCSKALSTALRLICGDRGGYNDPYFYGDGYTSLPDRTNIVDECCRKPCSYDELEKYCKPCDKNNKKCNKTSSAIMEEPLKIVKLP